MNWGEGKWFQFTDFLTGTHLLGSPVGHLELWDLHALGIPVSTREVSSYQPLPSAKCLGLKFKQMLKYTWLESMLQQNFHSCPEGSAWIKLAMVCNYFDGPKERKMCHFRAGCWAFLEGAEHPQLQGLSMGVDNAQCQSWNQGLLLDLLMASVCER